MCVICVKPAGKAFPSVEYMEKMFKTNDDGAGFMYARDGFVYIHKGFMSIKSFRKGLMKAGLTVDDIVIMHFRIATAGSTSPQNCHPFPVSNVVRELKATHIKTDLGLAHNGVLSYGGDEKLDLSDTQAFVREVLSHPPIRQSLFDLETFTLVEYAIGASKMVFLRGNGEYVLLGNWKDNKEKDECYYSNLNFDWAPVTRYSANEYQYSARKDGTWVQKTYSSDPKDKEADSRARTYILDESGLLIPYKPTGSTTPIKGLPANPTAEDLDNLDWDSLTEEEWQTYIDLKYGTEGRDCDLKTPPATPIIHLPLVKEPNVTPVSAKPDPDYNTVFVDYDDKYCPKCRYGIASIQQYKCTKCGVFFYRPHDWGSVYGGY